MKRFLLFLFVFIVLKTGAQTYNNEWIDYSKTYYKFKIAATGLYRINQSTLAGVGLSGADVNNFQLWRNGVEVPIYTSKQSGTLAAGDYLEFWGEMNDGKVDNALYRVADFQINDQWSLQTDTASYFLTLNPSTTNKRLLPVESIIPGGAVPESFFMYTAGKYYREKRHGGFSSQIESDYTYSSAYDQAEGWTSAAIANGATIATTFSDLFVSNDAGTPGIRVNLNLAGDANKTRRFAATLNGTEIFNQELSFYNYLKLSASFDKSLVVTNSAAFAIKNNTAETGSDRMVIGKIELTYPRQFNFGGTSVQNFPFELTASGSARYLDITGFSSNGGMPVLLDLTNGRRYTAAATSTGTSFKYYISPSAVTAKMVLVSAAASNFGTINTIERRDFVNYALAANQGDYLIISNELLNNNSSSGTNPLSDYKAYRSSVAGGGYRANIYMIDQLVDQFAFGIKKHPLSVRNFILWVRANYALPLKNVLLIGRGMDYINYNAYQSGVAAETLNMVPTFGWPASDNLFTATPGRSVPLTPIGRLSVINSNEVATYLNKVKQYEQWYTFNSPTIADKSWMKNVVHVVGAGSIDLTTLLSGSLNNHARIIKDSLFAGNVTTFVKSTADAVQQLSSSHLAKLMNDGVGLLTYFGHSSATTLEFNLDNPANYNNLGKYPIFNVLGCNAGSFFSYSPNRLLTHETLSEKYVLAPEKGSIAFLASTHFGIVHYLDIYNQNHYNALSRTKYGATLGEILDEGIKNMFNVLTENDFYARFQCEQYTLHGDPAIRYYAGAKPDYAIEDQLVKITPGFVSLAETSFLVDLAYVNIGKAVKDSITIEIKRTYPDLTTEVVQRKRVLFTTFKDSMTLQVPIVPTRDKGINKIAITLDADNEIDELYESNNTITKEVFIYEDEARPIYPEAFSIVNKPEIKLTISSANPFAELRQYVVEVDTTELFNSALKATRNISSSGGVFDTDMPLSLVDGRVYYWRVSPQPEDGQWKWNVSSFIYMPSSDIGFNQSHVYQHFKSGYERLKLDSASRNTNYNFVHRNITVHSGILGYSYTQAAGFSVAIDDNPFIRSPCGQPGIIFNVLDSISLVPWLNNDATGGSVPGQYGSDNVCFADRNWNFQYNLNTQSKRVSAAQFMDVIPDGSYVIVRNSSPASETPLAFVSNWQADASITGAGNTLYDKLKAQGFTTLDSFYRSRVFIFIYRKNRPEFTPQMVMSGGLADPPDPITLRIDLDTKDTLGYITSPKFGPAKGWKRLYWNGRSLDNQANGDRPTVNVIGINNAGVETTLFSNLNVTQQDFDVSSVDATLYPYMKLRMTNRDSVYATPYQLNYWRLTFDPVPEGAVAPNLYFSKKDTVDIGEPLKLGLGFKNISAVGFSDSLKVKVTVTDRNNVENIIPVPKQEDLKSGALLKLNVDIPTQSIPGLNRLYVNFNPDFDQPETSLFNNFAFSEFYVRPDSLNPVMDVTFDGVHILNRDIVSAKPNILIKLKDDAKWMVLDQQDIMSVKLRYPDGTIKTFDFDSDTLTFTGAGVAPNDNNSATITFKPWLLQDGEYELMVAGKDRSDNVAGNMEYRVAFQVINKPMISNMLNYPNPFTTSTAFVFTLTGSEVPQNIRIQILTITGKVVREITKDELGPLHIGNNITQFKWDGTDQYGAKLANGVYLYRVITNHQGKSLDKYKASGDNTDKYFNKGYGKMYLMR